MIPKFCGNILTSNYLTTYSTTNYFIITSTLNTCTCNFIFFDSISRRMLHFFNHNATFYNCVTCTAYYISRITLSRASSCFFINCFLCITRRASASIMHNWIGPCPSRSFIYNLCPLTCIS